MRPLELTVEGFRSHRHRATFDWRHRRLIGIVGPIGAGKSSILDAISFALYGKTPAVEGATKTLIHQLCTESHVELRFQVDGQVWRAVRALRRKGQSGHQLERLASDDDGAEVLERVTGDDPMKERVEQLLGMDFKAFCRSVLLAQNRFSEFLKATPADRDKVLKGVFGYERLDIAHVVAKARLDRERMRLDALGEKREAIDLARGRLDDARSQANTALDRYRQLESAAPEIERRETAIRDARVAIEATDATIERLDGIVASLPTPPEVEDAVVAAEGADAAIAEAERIREDADAVRATAEAALADVRGRLGDRERFRSFGRLVEQMEQETQERARAVAAQETRERELRAAAVSLTEALAEAKEAAAALTTADDDLAAAAAAVAEAKERLTQAQHAEMAHELRGALAAGEPCPVCAQPVATLPRKSSAPRTASARKAEAAARKAEEAARGRRDEASTRRIRADASVSTAEEREGTAGRVLAQATEYLATADAALAATQSQLAGWLGDGEDPRRALEAREHELEAAESAAGMARDALERARVNVDQVREAATSIREGLGRTANRLAGAWGRLGEDRDVIAEPEAVRASFAELAATIVERHAAARTARETAEVLATEASAALVTLLEDLGLPPGTNLVRALADAQAAHASATTIVEELERQIASASDVERETLEAEHARDLANRLAEDLKPSRFLGFLLQEERVELAELGSAHFEELTDGAYRFSEDDTFGIVDVNGASQVRKADSLSGGETFLASLALALALAEMVARGGGRLDSFFLDEGFGSLDPEHLDRAMDGIARLVAGDADRLVVLVSHVEQMRQTLEDLIVLDKDPRTGDTIVVSGASVEP
jgi:exonuclease SbcC